ncbi:protein FAM110A [Cololabis saira]|uniref:protein FAM110A n=1 Tax=Cololabis saira TaxID=129043 RepID=UPI002AD3E563|nr:protein FAM110A [Cololabis saira]XP_061592860.1 protein FAM110A [Cololabis saira]XP_061592861.1 protein FAM110A [Cololabis saira]
MPVETLRPSDGRLAALPFASAMPFRILNKGPAYFRRPAEGGAGARKPSAVERLEADKAKYVKSQQVALTRQAPIQPPIIRKPLLPPGAGLAALAGHHAPVPARRVREPERRPALNLDVLNHLIGDVCGSGAGAASPSSSSPSSSSPSSGGQSGGSTGGVSPAPGGRRVELVRRLPPVPARAPRLIARAGTGGGPGPPNTVTVRRVDVRPPQRTPLQPRPLRPRQTPQGQVAPPPPQTPPPAFPLTPGPAPPPPRAAPPASPAFTRLSGASSRGSSRRPGAALHRSQSDLSDRLSRATADLERFFNYCGLDPGQVAALGGVERFAPRASSDIVSVSKLRSASSPSSSGGNEERRTEDEDEEDGPVRPGDRVPYGISVIERNARVIKWLYGIRQARDPGSAVSNV